MKYEHHHEAMTADILSFATYKGACVNKSQVMAELTKKYRKEIGGEFDAVSFALEVNYLLLKMKGEGLVGIENVPYEPPMHEHPKHEPKMSERATDVFEFIILLLIIAALTAAVYYVWNYIL